ncbi:hypothetical protein Xsto_03853 [Xenorhabdus stockiae]|uniref:Uncharacterized protein n=1 Tax=Xenorhabdus stockiae TaxID=351614 RepID=A0A2D0KBL3_9GAMM|nr:hypothetical protein Xsto_03853 [Xenorhabdus stockiae]
MHGKQIIAGRFLDIGKLILSTDLTERQDLQAVFLAVGRIHKQVLESAIPPGFLQGGFQVIDAFQIGQWIGQVDNHPGMTAVLVIIHAEGMDLIQTKILLP